MVISTPTLKGHLVYSTAYAKPPSQTPLLLTEPMFILYYENKGKHPPHHFGKKKGEIQNAFSTLIF